VVSEARQRNDDLRIYDRQRSVQRIAKGYHELENAAKLDDLLELTIARA